MEQVTQEQVRQAIHDFLLSQYKSRTETERKQLIKAQEDADYEKVAELNEKLAAAKEKYSLEVWMHDAANRMAKQLHFGTHISKGIHTKSNGNNVTFSSRGSKLFVGTHNITDRILDASDNAAALPLAYFFEYLIDVESNLKISDAILDNIADIRSLFSNDKLLSHSYYSSFYDALFGDIKTPITDKLNKQILWPISGDTYINLVPLYPSVFTSNVYKKLNNLRFSEENKLARENRSKKTAEQKSYLSINSIAVNKLGGTKPLNVSLLTFRQGGKNYLLPSLPPQFKQRYRFKLQPHAKSLFSRGLEFRCKEIFDALIRLIKTQYNNVNIRNARKDILDSLLYEVLVVANSIREEYPAGWSKEYSLDINEKLWLDPQRAEQDKQFADQRQELEWQREISIRFANWVNYQLRQQLKNIKYEFADAEHLEWQREMQDLIQESRRMGLEVFQ